ncbi:MAG: thioredoxin domain-containing protein [Chromatiales bacterium]|nr:thioredoxin domain-containing protein [Chromatiales bacterium]
MQGNRLRESTSPYLQQHADNPVHWHPWDEQALALAAKQNKPILLSIGYSACHWCHVMAHESFEDEETAALMNDLYINIKVDREERPDLDKIYQSAHQLLSQRPGGWPLTVFLTPGDQVPFFAGTYFPKAPRYGMPSFKEILTSIANAYQTQNEEISKQNQSLLQALSGLNPEAQALDSLDSIPLENARQQLARSFDETHGGFGQAPKFPHPTSLNRMLRHWAATAAQGVSDPRSLYIVDYSLTRMALGGFNDQLGGGFCRYSVDDQWMIPHFEKMLYDNGPLLTLYSDMWLATGKTLFKESAEQTADWVIREMQSPAGGYYSTLDADSEGEEGRFYVWTPEQVKALLDEEEYRHFALCYGLDRAANFEGKWHLHNFSSVAKLNDTLGSTGGQARELLQSAREKLFIEREKRIHPGRDEKILTSWNALMIKGMVRAGRLLARPDYIASAEQALNFIRGQLWKDGRLLATHLDGTSALNAYLDDYAFLIDALLELLSARWDSDDFDFAIRLTETLLDHFQDSEQGGFFFTADDHEQLIHRPKPLSDDSTPAGNGVVALVLGRLGHLCGEMRYLDAAERTLKASWAHLSQIPNAHCSLLEALEEQLNPTETIIIRGTADELTRWHQRAIEHYAPRRLVLAIPDDAEGLTGLLAERKSLDGTCAYICSGTQCEAPLEEFEQFSERLSETEAPAPQAGDQSFSGSAGSFKRHRE